MSQLELLAKSRRSEPGDVTDDVIVRLPHMLAAIKLCVQVSGFEDKQVCDALSLDAAQWSRIKAGTANFPTNKVGDLMDYCGNEIPLRWSAAMRGYELKRLYSRLYSRLYADLSRPVGRWLLMDIAGAAVLVGALVTLWIVGDV